ncbi:MAG: HD domain-containing protein [Acidimicrobiales bacterium]
MGDRSETTWLERAIDDMKTGETDPSGGAPTERLAQQLGFLLELDKAKSVVRRSYLTDGSRLENDAEHMWHATMAALLLAEHANGRVDPLRLACMLAVHDIVEIDAGDTFVYDTAGYSDKAERETAAADRIFGLLPSDQAAELRGLWDEFEAHESLTARMAAAIDRLLPVLLNRATGGRTWAEHGIAADRVFSLNSKIDEGSRLLWAFARSVLDAAVHDGVLAE